MKIWTLFSMMISLISCSTVDQMMGRERINDELLAREVATDVMMVSDEAYHHSNVMVARMDDSTVLIASSPFETKNADALVSWVKKKYSPSRIIAINTHFHSDGTGGNEAYQKHGVEIWASDLTQRLHKERGESNKIVEVKAFEASPVLIQRIHNRRTVPAGNVFPLAKGKTFTFKDRSAQVFYPGPAHTKDNVVVYLPQRKVLFGGCMIKPGKDLGNVADADLGQYANSAEKLKYFDVGVVIPGHGDQLGGVELIDNTLSLARSAQEPKAF